MVEGESVRSGESDELVAEGGGDMLRVAEGNGVRVLGS